MRKWDIVDIVEPNEDVVSRSSKRTALRAMATSAAQVAFVVTLAVANTAHFTVKKCELGSTLPTEIKFVDSPRASRPSIPSVPSVRHRGAADSDTQLGQSTLRLAQLAEAHFTPVEEEEAFDEDYSF
jgi:hypothetical protein